MLSTPEHREASREALINRQRREATKQLEPRTVSHLRDAILHAMAPDDHEDIFYDRSSMALLSEFEEALRRAWERDARFQVLQRAEAAMKATIASLDVGGLL